jgi:hypothetical protein
MSALLLTFDPNRPKARWQPAVSEQSVALAGRDSISARLSHLTPSILASILA